MEISLVLVLFALLPAVVAFARSHNSKLAIAALNLVGCLLAVTFLGIPIAGILWLWALIWALTGNVNNKPKAKIFD